ncbi:hypothetical protein [Bacillus sp. Marseille-P3661]|uniref:YqgU-like beta propeller domain-containing protein n=1 Tax=Bacillus sp. Marseille-P3661 TaxID=1936234 RepID=UPI000C84A8E3|nr:hypothetical protein [Bacillus sp. Marseille-P3661]
MKKALIIVVCIFIVGCTSPREVVNEAPPSKVKLVKKNSISKHFIEEGSIKGISMNKGEFYGVNEWYNNHTIIYSVGDNGITSLYLHNIHTGQKDLFYQTENFLISIKANNDNSRFAVHTVENSGKANLTILDSLGNIVYSWSELVDEIQYRWNPYKSDEVILTTFLPFLQFEVIAIDINNGESRQIPVKNPFVQWINESKIGYLNWNQNEPSIYAPLYIVDLNTSVEQIWIEKCIMFFSLYNTVVTISVDEDKLDHSLYSFYDGETGNKIKDIYIPILNTFSEAWWIPSYDFDRNRKLFYYLEPKYAADISEYNEGYQLKTISIHEDKTEVLTTVENNVPIKLSPDGSYLLMGQQLEQIIQLSSKQVLNLLE